MLGRIEGRRRRGWRRMRWLDGIIEHESEQTPGDSKGQGSLGFCSPWGHDWVTEQLCWIHPVSGVYHFNTLTLVVTYQKEGQRATELPDSVTGFLTPACDCLWNNARGRNQDPNTFVPHDWLQTVSPYLR